MNPQLTARRKRKVNDEKVLEEKPGASKGPSEKKEWPRRDIRRLFCPTVTYLCANGTLPSPYESKEPCVPCAYKVCNFDTALDVDFSKRVPNKRPEQCPRASHLALKTKIRNTDLSRTDPESVLGYQPGMSVLTVGDGDFSFSLAIARLVIKGNISCENQGTIVATSYENVDTLRRVYPDFDVTVNSLKLCGERNVVIAYGVDGTKLEDTLPKTITCKFNQENKGVNKKMTKFHRICWNFPCTAIGNGKDGQNDAMEQNKALVRNFVVSALQYLDESCGEIHMAHKTKPPFNQWGLDKVALSSITENNFSKFGSRRLEFKGRIVFDKCVLPPYTPRKALDRKSFPCHDACIYVFGWETGGANDILKTSTLTTGGGRPLFQRTIPEYLKKDKTLRQEDLLSVIALTDEMIEKTRSIHLLHADVLENYRSNGKKKRPFLQETKQNKKNKRSPPNRNTFNNKWKSHK